MNLKELARMLELSPTTVSRALNGYPEVNADTRRRVQEAAARHNYRPNMRAKSLATGRAMAIGHVIPMSTKHEMVNPIFADFIAGAGETYSRAGYDMVLSVVSDADEARIYRDLRSRGTVDGVIVHAPNANDPRIALLGEIGLPFVVHGRATGAATPYSWLDINNRRAFRRATEFLLDLGHRRIGLINGIENMDFAIRRRTGYLDALAARGVAADPALMAAGEMTEGLGHRAATAMLALPDPPTALLVSSIIPAIGVRRAAADIGLALGRELSVITHDDELSYLRNGEAVPLFTATRSSVRLAGRLAAEMLLEIIAAPDTPPRQRLLEADLIMGLSTGPAPDRRNART
ncbi:MAG: LacI family DNA-binding transcriptional regulator [Rhodobacteraceae bacterium]|nr:LacI family DNA-binding transcriptional regulator [Paracoccaceae bacterium]